MDLSMKMSGKSNRPKTSKKTKKDAEESFGEVFRETEKSKLAIEKIDRRYDVVKTGIRPKHGITTYPMKKDITRCTPKRSKTEQQCQEGIVVRRLVQAKAHKVVWSRKATSISHNIRRNKRHEPQTLVKLRKSTKGKGKGGRQIQHPLRKSIKTELHRPRDEKDVWTVHHPSPYIERPRNVQTHDVLPPEEKVHDTVRWVNQQNHPVQRKCAQWNANWEDSG